MSEAEDSSTVFHRESSPLLELIGVAPWSREVLMYSFDFEVLSLERPTANLQPTQPVSCVTEAQNATGGEYFRLQAPGSGAESVWYYLDPNGEMCPVAASSTDLLQLVVTYPYWLELARHQPRTAQQARPHAQALEAELLEDMPTFEEARSELLTTLDLSAPDPLDSFLALQGTALLPPLNHSLGLEVQPLFKVQS